jgi:DNA-binding SARP family transcriptional activator
MGRSVTISGPTANRERSFAYQPFLKRPRKHNAKPWANLAQYALRYLQCGRLDAAEDLLRQLLALDVAPDFRPFTRNQTARWQRFSLWRHTPTQRIAPSPVSVYALGGFTVAIDGTAMEERFKPQHKPLDVLRALVISSGQPTAATKLADTLWPESEGDAARNCLRVAIHRLRSFILHKDAVVFRDGKVFLNPQLCWVDAWAFEQKSDRLSHIPDEALTLRQELVDAVAIYSGHLFAHELEPWWTIAARERLRCKWLCLVLRLGRYYEARSCWWEACEVYRRALWLDPVAEALYRRLMFCQHETGQDVEMRNTYALCQNQLQASLGTTPGLETQSLYELLSGT